MQAALGEKFTDAKAMLQKRAEELQMAKQDCVDASSKLAQVTSDHAKLQEHIKEIEGKLVRERSAANAIAQQLRVELMEKQSAIDAGAAELKQVCGALLDIDFVTSDNPCVTCLARELLMASGKRS